MSSAGLIHQQKAFGDGRTQQVSAHVQQPGNCGRIESGAKLKRKKEEEEEEECKKCQTLVTDQQRLQEQAALVRQKEDLEEKQRLQ